MDVNDLSIEMGDRDGTYRLNVGPMSADLDQSDLEHLDYEVRAALQHGADRKADRQWLDTKSDDELADDEFWANIHKPRHVVAVYERDRAYGGPEEDGWWYDTGTLARYVDVESVEAVELLAEAMATEYPRTGNAGSVVYRGGDYSVMVLDREAQSDLDFWFDERLEPIAYYPLNTPRYE